MHISFITGNAGKFSEAEALLGMSLTQVKLELPELQGLDAQEVMRHKLEAAKEAGIGPCIVEDSSLSFMCLGNQLPGPFIKWFEEALGIDGLVTLVEKYGDARATATTLVGYVDAAGSTHIFEGTLEGTIVPARGDQDFGYGPVFEPAGCAKTFGEMTREEKHAVSSRAIAFRKMKDYLEQVRA